MNSVNTFALQEYNLDEHISVGQYVRAEYQNGKSEIGIVSAVDSSIVTISTSNGYEVSVRRNVVKKAFLLILDLNGVLVARGRGCCIHRPYAKEFLDFAFKNFAIGVWTSGLQRSCDPIIESVMGEYKNRLLFIFYREKCEPAPTPTNEFGTKKNLKYIFDMFPDSFHSVNTIIIDDSPEKCSNPDIALCPAPFDDPYIQRNDEELKEVISVLEEVLAHNSHFPLIRARERRILRLAKNENSSSTTHVDSVPPPLPSRKKNSCIEKVSLWSYRLCCEYVTSGSCKYGAKCQFRHEADDGVRPCSLKGYCKKGHAHRWKG